MKVLDFKNILILAVIGGIFFIIPLLRNSTKDFSEYKVILEEEFGEDAQYSYLSITWIEKLGYSLFVTQHSDSGEEKGWNYFNKEWKERNSSSSDEEDPVFTLEEIDFFLLNTMKEDAESRSAKMNDNTRFQDLVVQYSYETEDWVVEMTCHSESPERDYLFFYNLNGEFLGRGK